jgi:hypothetical protein
MDLEFNMFNISGNTATKSRELNLEIKDFRGGSNTLLDEARIAPNEATTATNLIQVQDGLWKPRWGTQYYGATHDANIDGAYEYVKSDGTTELITIAGGKAYKSTDGGSLTELTGATFTAGTQCYFIQIAGWDNSTGEYKSYLYITNGTDNLARYNGTSLSTYTQISTPTGLTGSRVASGLSSGVYTYYAEVTALNSIGETTPAAEASITVNKIRDNWVAATDKGIAWSWNAVAGADRYQLYISDESGDEVLLASTTATSFTDDGSLDPNPYIEPSLSNTTTGPKVKSMCVSGNRIWATYDTTAPYIVYFSGSGKYIGAFSDFYGGGWIALERGGREMPTKVVHYQTGQGEGRLTVLCRTPEGKGAVWQIAIEPLTVGDTIFSIPSAIKVVGSFGTDSINGVVQTNNDVLFPNRRGMYSLGPEKNYYGILRTNELTTRIRPYWTSLAGSKLADIAGYFFDSKVFISVPTNTTGNTKTIIYDTERVNWVVDWSIAGKQWLEYTDSLKINHLLYVPVGGTKLIEVSEGFQGDLGAAFTTDYTSGRMPLQKLWKDFVKVDKVYLKLGNPRGSINFEISGTTKNAPFTSLGTASITSTTSNTGMGWDLMGAVKMGTTTGTPSTFSDSSDPRYIKVRKKLRDIQLRVTTNSTDADYILQGFIINGNALRVKAPASWKAS